MKIENCGKNIFRGEKSQQAYCFSMKIQMMDLWMQIEGTKLIFITNFSVLDFFRMPRIAQILIWTFQIFRTPIEISSLFFFISNCRHSKEQWITLRWMVLMLAFWYYQHFAILFVSVEGFLCLEAFLSVWAACKFMSLFMLCWTFNWFTWAYAHSTHQKQNKTKANKQRQKKYIFKVKIMYLCTLYRSVFFVSELSAQNAVNLEIKDSPSCQKRDLFLPKLLCGLVWLLSFCPDTLLAPVSDPMFTCTFFPIFLSMLLAQLYCELYLLAS